MVAIACTLVAKLSPSSITRIWRRTMVQRRYPRLVGTRVTAAEGALVDSLAKLEGKTLQDLTREILLRGVRDGLRGHTDTIILAEAA